MKSGNFVDFFLSLSTYSSKKRRKFLYSLNQETFQIHADQDGKKNSLSRNINTDWMISGLSSAQNIDMTIISLRRRSPCSTLITPGMNFTVFYMSDSNDPSCWLNNIPLPRFTGIDIYNV